MTIYLRKILAHDITHQISITKEVLNSFFGVYEEKVITMKGKKSGNNFDVKFLLSTDPRLGGEITQLINAEGGIKENDILLFIKTKDNFTVEVINELDERYTTFISMLNIERHLVINVDNFTITDQIDSLIDIEKDRISTGCNVLLYGVPGSGKSWTINHEYSNNESKIERLVFHPDYTYSDFIGQILPNVAENGQVSYKFTPGPFTNILREAYNNPKVEYILIVEEINRGNAPAIFGEVFQLLDRKLEVLTNGNDDGFPIGTSEYGINNLSIAEEMYGKDRKHDKVRIPSNLSIIATMNTSDQNVFTLDTAFQRRWNMRLIENSFENANNMLADAKILDTTITWKTFCTEINKIIIENSARMPTAEDKRLGIYFVHYSDLTFDARMQDLEEYDILRKKENNDILSCDEKVQIAEIRAAIKQNRKFPEKVIKYLWDDAFKFNREMIFDTNKYKSLEEVIKAFMYAKDFTRFQIFKGEVINIIGFAQDDSNSKE